MALWKSENRQSALHLWELEQARISYFLHWDLCFLSVQDSESEWVSSHSHEGSKLLLLALPQRHLLQTRLCLLKNSHDEAITPNMMVFVGGPVRDRFRCDHESRVLKMGLMPFWEEEMPQHPPCLSFSSQPTRKKDLTRTRPCQHPGIRLPASRTLRKYISIN